MNTNLYFPIIVDLSQFFYDHRRTARIFINDSIKSVSDLQNRLTHIFSIQDFYLSTGGHFLPESEDIGVLQKNETVCVIPKSPATDQSPSWDIKRIKEKKQVDLEMITEENEIASPKKKKCKKRHRTAENDFHEAKSRKSKRDGDDDVLQQVHKKKKKDREKHSVSQGSMNESVQTVSAIRRKLKEETEEHIKKYSKANDQSNYSIKTVLPKIQDHIKLCNDFGRANAPESVRLSRHVDTPITKYKKYVPPDRITDQYLAKNKVNIVRIDVVKEANEQTSNTPVNETPSNPTVREIINSFEESSSHNASVAIKDTPKNEDSKNSIEMKINGHSSNHAISFEDVIISSSENQYSNFGDKSNVSVSSTPFKKDIKPSVDCHTISESSSFAEAIELSSIRSDVSTKPDSSDLSELRPDFAKLLGSLREKTSAELVYDNLRDCLTKRRRVRKRKKLSKDASEIKPSVPLTSVSIQLDQSATPNVHIKFDDAENSFNAKETTTEDKTPDNAKSSAENNIDQDAIVLSDDNGEPVTEIQHIGTEADIVNAPAMDGIQPKIGDIIAFKVLKMDNDYTPQLSSFVIGRVMLYTPATNNIFIEILKGRKELVLPSGKLSIDGEDEEPTKTLKEFSWSGLMERKLLYSKRCNFIQNQTGENNK